MSKQNYLKILLAVPLFIAGAALVKIGTSQSVPNPVSLQVLASQSGNYVKYVTPDFYPRSDFNTVVNESTDIITGTAGTNVCKVSPDGTFITTDFQVTVNSVSKGSLPIGANITVSLPGGKAGFPVPCATTPCPPPNTAEIRVPWFKRLSNGSQYYLFLTGKGQTLAFKPTAGPEGVFQVANGAVTSNSGRLHDPMWQYNNMSLVDFNLAIEHAYLGPPPPNLPRP